MATKEDIVKLKDSYGKFVVAPLAKFGFGGFVFDVTGEEQLSIEAEITDHYIEDNSVLNDTMAVRPLTFTLKNYVGELVYEDDTDIEGTLDKLATKLTTVAAFISPVSDAFFSLKSIAESDSLNYEESLDELSDLWSLTKNLNPQASRQQQAYLYFEALITEKILISVQTPFKYLTNMAVQSVSAVQKEGSDEISEFSITLKQVRLAEVEFSTISTATTSTIANQMKSTAKTVGRTQGESSSFALDLVEGLF